MRSIGVKGELGDNAGGIEYECYVSTTGIGLDDDSINRFFYVDLSACQQSHRDGTFLRMRSIKKPEGAKLPRAANFGIRGKPP